MQDSIECPKCGRVSFNPNDVAEKFCGVCGYHDVEVPPLSESLAAYITTLKERAREHGKQRKTRVERSIRWLTVACISNSIAVIGVAVAVVFK